MTSTNSSGGTLGVTFDEPVRTVQGEEITVVSKIAYGRQLEVRLRRRYG
ncbi:MAG TPA: hypothetical protein IAA61_05215 [Candidatus Ornithomonoglobus merdipullorum]|uniref:Uncharacterized protein n=1 Tax=Candidatus Ornithomonoglobus merdipullorum TaxID=2840895 RepID=A0A9D1MBG4_9FIRM|nr:hypothetical protein [Candidatus Ornithomonoglobus merdipullorum]